MSLIGSRISHYEVEELLGEGGMGVVYRARDTRLKRPVALKVLKGDLVADPDRNKRFFREARAAAAVTHPAIAQIYDVGEENGQLFMAMEFIEGKTLRRLIRHDGLEIDAGLDIAVQAADGLARAHRAGIVHRDVKSDNIMVTPDGHAKVLDFGLAKLLDPDGDGDDSNQLETVTRTETGVLMGTIPYMSPEQTRGEHASARSDVFAFGIVLYEIVTGKLPFKRKTSVDTMHAIAFEPPPPYEGSSPSGGLDAVIQRCLQKEPGKRYADAGELVADLRRARDGQRPLTDNPADTFSEFRTQATQVEAHLVGAFGSRTKALFAVGFAAAVLLLVLGQVDLGNILFLGLLGMLGYRWIRNESDRMIRRFAKKVSKNRSVKAITRQGRRLTVVLDVANPKLFNQVNELKDSINKKRWRAEPIEVAVRDDISEDELRDSLRGSGVVYLRKDALV